MLDSFLTKADNGNQVDGGIEVKNPVKVDSTVRQILRTRLAKKHVLTFAACMILADKALAQSTTSPWTQAVQSLQTAFTGPIATGLALVAIVVGGLMFAFGEGAAKRTLSGVIFGVGMAVGAVNFMSWLFP